MSLDFLAEGLTLKSLIACFFLIFCICSCQKKSTHPIRGNIVEAVYGLGTVDTDEKFIAKSAIINSVKEFYVTAGEDVLKGQKLFRTDQQIIIRSPYPGRVSHISVSVEENLFPQTVILTVFNLKKLYLTVSLEQQAIMRIHSNLNAEVSFEFFRNKKIQGKITTIYPSEDQFIAKVELAQWPSGILPGMTADVAIEIDQKKDVILVPSRAIVNGHLIIKRDGKKIKLPVNIGLVDLEQAEIISPELKLTDEVILP